MQIYLGSDHGGFELKEKFKQYLFTQQPSLDVKDCGALLLEPSDDYPPIAWQVAQKVAKQNNNALGILFCRSGAGMAIVANKVRGIRAVELFDQELAAQAKSHNQANVLTFSGEKLTLMQAVVLFEIFMKTPFDQDERHQRRLEQINNYEKEKHEI